MTERGKGDDQPSQTGLFEASSVSASATAPLHMGHRDRLRDRFGKGGADAQPDYELLELVLFRALPRRGTKDLAKRLIARFGSFAEVINAPEGRLKEVTGVGDPVVTEFRLVHAAATRLTRTGLIQRPLLSSHPDVLAYLTSAQGYEQKELFRVLFLDKKNRLIADEVHGKGTVDHTPVYVREVVKRALELSATAIILVHNHPSGGSNTLTRRYPHNEACHRCGQAVGSDRARPHCHGAIGTHKYADDATDLIEGFRGRR